MLAIGAAKAGVARFVDKSLAKPYPASVLMIRYLQNPPFDDFYLSGIDGIEEESHARFSKPFLKLNPEMRQLIVDAAATSSTTAWTGPDPFFFYFISRTDAVMAGAMPGAPSARSPIRLFFSGQGRFRPQRNSDAMLTFVFWRCVS